MMSTEKIDVVVAGHICLDVIPTFTAHAGSPDALFIPGKLVEVGAPIITTGGAVSNTGLALHRLGVRTKLVGKVGDDLFGRAILDVLEGYDPKLARGMVVAAGEASSYSAIISPQDTDRIIFHCPGTNDTFHPSEVLLDALRGAQIFHFGYPPLMHRTYADGGAALARLFEQIRQTGLLVSLDMALPDPQSPAGQVNWTHWLETVLPHVDLFGPSIDELLFMLGYPQSDLGSTEIDGKLLSEVSEKLLHMGARIVLIKLGEHGLYLRPSARQPTSTDPRSHTFDSQEWLGREIYSPCFQVEVKGTTGAGDCTLAGFLAALVHNQAPEQALTSAVGVGACSVEAADSTSGVQPWTAVQSRIASGWKHRNIALKLDDWTPDATTSLWYGPNDRVRSRRPTVA